MKKFFLWGMMFFSSLSYAENTQFENELDCGELSVFFKNCAVGDKKCTTRNLAVTEKMRVCHFTNYDLIALSKITPDLKKFNQLIIETPISTYSGLKEMLELTIVKNLNEPSNYDELTDSQKKDVYKKNKALYSAIADKLSYVEKTTNMKLLNTHVPKLNETKLFNKDDFIQVQEDVSVLMTFFDLMYMNYSSFDTSANLIAELYPNGISNDISYKRSGEGRYSDFECALMDRLLNFMDDKLLEVLYERACIAPEKNEI